MNKTLMLYFDSVEELKQKAIPHSINLQACKRSDEEKKHRRKGMKDWYGVDTEEELLKTINSGWAEGVQKALQIKESIEQKINPVGKIRRRKYSDEGEEIDISRYITREYDTMMISTGKVLKIKANSPLKIMVSIGGNCQKSNDQMFWKGAVASVLTDILESAGYRVQLTGYSHTCKTFLNAPVSDLYFDILLKDYNDPLNLETITTVTALSGFYRWFGFKTKWAQPYTCDCRLGYTIETLPNDIKADIVINDIYDRNSAFQFINNTLNRLIEGR